VEPREAPRSSFTQPTPGGLRGDMALSALQPPWGCSRLPTRPAQFSVLLLTKPHASRPGRLATSGLTRALFPCTVLEGPAATQDNAARRDDPPPSRRLRRTDAERAKARPATRSRRIGRCSTPVGCFFNLTRPSLSLTARRVLDFESLRGPSPPPPAGGRRWLSPLRTVYCALARTAKPGVGAGAGRTLSKRSIVTRATQRTSRRSTRDQAEGRVRSVLGRSAMCRKAMCLEDDLRPQIRRSCSFFFFFPCPAFCEEERCWQRTGTTIGGDDGAILSGGQN